MDKRSFILYEEDERCPFSVMGTGRRKRRRLKGDSKFLKVLTKMFIKDKRTLR